MTPQKVILRDIWSYKYIYVCTVCVYVYNHMYIYLSVLIFSSFCFHKSSSNKRIYLFLTLDEEYLMESIPLNQCAMFLI